METDQHTDQGEGEFSARGDWSPLEEEFHSHTHTGGEDGPPIPREGIQPGAIDGTRIDPASSVTVAQLKVVDRDLLAEIDSLLLRATALESKLDGNLQARKLSLQGNKSLIELGAGVTDKEPESGKIAFRCWSDGLEIVGVGKVPEERKITFYAQGGTTFYGKLGIGAVSPTETLSVGGEDACIELGADDTDKDADSGKIAFRRWSDGLDIVGVGNTPEERRITFHAKGGAAFLASTVTVTGELHAQGVRVRGQDPLAHIDALARRASQLELGKVNRTGDSISGSLTVSGGLTVNGDLQYGGRLSKVDTHEGFTASVRSADLCLGYSERRGQRFPDRPLGRVLVDLTDTLQLNYDSDWPRLRISGKDGIFLDSASIVLGSQGAPSALEVHGPVALRGDRLRNAQGFNILETNAVDWLRINPEQQFPAVAIFKSLALGSGGLAVGNWSVQPPGQLKVTGSAFIDGSLTVGTGGTGSAFVRYINSDGSEHLHLNAATGKWVIIGSPRAPSTLEVYGQLVLYGDRLRNAKGFNILQTDAVDWLRINPEQHFPSVAIYKSLALGTGGLAVGDWSVQPPGQLKVTGSAFVDGGLTVGAGGTGTAFVRYISSDSAEHLYLNYSNRKWVVIGCWNHPSGLDIHGPLVIYGDRLRNAKGFSILQTDAVDWLRINPDLQFPAVAIYKSLALGSGGLAVGDWSVMPHGQLKVTGDTFINGSLTVGPGGTGRIAARSVTSDAGDHLRLNPANKMWVVIGSQNAPSGLDIYGQLVIHGNRLRNAQGFNILQTDAVDWLRINPDLNFPAVAIHNALAVGLGGLAVGEWSVQPPGQLKVTGDTFINGYVGTNGFHPREGLPRGWGGGVHTWDVVARGTGRAVRGWQSGGWDLAEKFDKHDPTLEPGDVVVADPSTPERLIRSSAPYERTLLGVISEKPGFLLGVAWEDPVNPISLGLAGRLPVKVSLEAGPIRIGEPLTSSSVPGHAMRATRSGRVLGIALEDFDGSKGQRGKIVMLLNPHWQEAR